MNKRREIKFRFWSTVLKKFVIPDDSIFVGALKDPKMCVLQYIGLQDKNGIDIYDGDIVRYNTGETWFVEWDKPQAGFLYMNKQVVDELGRKKPSGIGYGQLPGGHEIEIIGNIYENPELLKQA